MDAKIEQGAVIFFGGNYGIIDSLVRGLEQVKVTDIGMTTGYEVSCKGLKIVAEAGSDAALAALAFDEALFEKRTTKMQTVYVVAWEYGTPTGGGFEFHYEKHLAQQQYGEEIIAYKRVEDAFGVYYFEFQVEENTPSDHIAMKIDAELMQLCKDAPLKYQTPELVAYIKEAEAEHLRIKGDADESTDTQRTYRHGLWCGK